VRSYDFREAYGLGRTCVRHSSKSLGGGHLRRRNKLIAFPLLSLALVIAVAWIPCLVADSLLPEDDTRSAGSLSGSTYQAWLIFAYDSTFVDRLDSSWYAPAQAFHPNAARYFEGSPDPESLVPPWASFLSPRTNNLPKGTYAIYSFVLWLAHPCVFRWD